MPAFSILKKRRDFVRLTKHGEFVPTKNLVLQAAPSNLQKATGEARIGYTTTKKIGKAHIRNRCRRRLRAAVALFFAQHSLPDFDYVLIARYTTADADFRELCRDLCYALKKVNARFMEKEVATKDNPISISNLDKNVSKTNISPDA